jgi:cell surface protein SprA
MIERDPSNDDFVHFRQFPDNAPILERYRYFNGQEGNSKPTESNASVQSASTNYPDRKISTTITLSTSLKHTINMKYL